MNVLTSYDQAMSAMSNSEDGAMNASNPLSRKPGGISHGTKIYFILCRATGRVKCGIAADPRARLAGLQTGSPTPLKLIAEIDGDGLREKWIHQRLARWRVHGEWFQYVPGVCDVIADEVASHLKNLYCGLYGERTSLQDMPASVTDPNSIAKIDPCAEFIEQHVRTDPGGRGVQARAMYDAYKAWCDANGSPIMFETRFGRLMKTKLRRDDTGRLHVYVDVALLSPRCFGKRT